LYPLKQGYIELIGAKNSDIAMARAKRHYIPGQIWHTPVKQNKKRFNGVNYPSMPHKREFLLKFAKDRRRWLQ
jgi:hypothetical protein